MIDRVTVEHYRVPRSVWSAEQRIGASGYEISHFELVVCEVDAEGVSGLGFTYTVGHGGAAVAAMLDREIAPELVGRDPAEASALWHELHRKLHFVGASGVTAVAIAAADIALWDARARAAGLPLYRFLGAHRSELPAYASAVNLALSRDELVAQMVSLRDAGYGALKMKVGGPFRDDVERVRAVREAIGDDCGLMLDANMAWDVAEAARRFRAFEPFDPYWLEEPLAPHDVRGHAALQRSTAVPIAAGETLFTPAEFAAYFAAEAFRIPQPDVIRLGVTGWLEVAAMAREHGLPLAPHFIPEIHVHLACAVRNALVLEHLALFAPLVEQPIQVRGGMARPSERPGHGLAFDRDVLDPHRVERKEARV